MTYIWRIWNYLKLLFVKSPSIISEQFETPYIGQLVEQPEQPELPEPLVYTAPRAKWVKPKGTEKLIHKERSPSINQKPKQTRIPRPRLKSDDNPEKWGQYYFRDAILDQLDTYFYYLRRMRHNDREAYNFHRQMGIHVVPKSALETFDNWRDKGELDELSAWWINNRPGFGAIAYSTDDADEYGKVVDAPPEYFKEHYNEKNKFNRSKPIMGLTGGKTENIYGKEQSVGIFWVPKFLYFIKYRKPPLDVERVSDGDVYKLTVYWDRISGMSRTKQKRFKGVPQEYAVCVERDSKNVRVLKTLNKEPIRIRGRDGAFFRIPNKHWGISEACLRWAGGRQDVSPEDYLRRCFIEAALMYESSALGSMVRIEAIKDKLTAAFGVDIKRMAYFFKDRDVTLTEAGARARIFHIVKPHIRLTKTGETPVKMHFRGLKEFTWANYKIKITVPGRDHFIVPEFDVGVDDMSKKEAFRRRDRLLDSEQIATELTNLMKEGHGAWQHPHQKEV